jgi:hypothetical protein
MNDSEERFQKWCRDDLVNEKWFSDAINKNENETLKIVGWVCTLYLKVALLFEKNLITNQRKYDQIKQMMLTELGRYLSSVLKTPDISLEDVKKRMRMSSNMDGLCKISFSAYHVGYKNESTKLLNEVDIDSVKFNMDDFLSIKLDLSSTHDYYVAKKTLMKYFKENKTNADNIKTEMFPDIIRSCLQFAVIN